MSIQNIRNQLSLATRIPNKTVNISKVNTTSDNVSNPAMVTEQVSPSNNISMISTTGGLNFKNIKPEGSPTPEDLRQMALN